MLILLLACIRPGLPGRSHRGPLPPADAELSASAARIAETLDTLALDIGPRSAHAQPAALARAADAIEEHWRALGFFVERQPVGTFGPPGGRGQLTWNLIARVPGTGPPLIVGAHYDTVPETPGADDNASGVAALLDLSRHFRPDAREPRGREVHFVAWTTEEPPFFASEAQGSAIHAASLDAAYGAISIEMVGTYGEQRAPFPLGLAVPDDGDFIAFLSNPQSHRFVREVGRSFRTHEDFPSWGGTAPVWIQGIDWSDHRSYWHLGPSVMVTDTSFLRTDHYHQATDTPEKLDPERIARVTRGLLGVVRDLVATAPAPPVKAPSLTRVKPGYVDMTRGGRVVLDGSGFDAATTVRVGDRRVPVIAHPNPGRLVVHVEDGPSGVFDVTVEGLEGVATLPAALEIGAGQRRQRPRCDEVVYFDHDSAELSPEAVGLLERVRFCYTARSGPIAVIGYTDAVGEADYNLELGEKRAEAVSAALQRFGIAEERLEVRSAGEAGPFAAGQRRRVEIRSPPDSVD